MFRPIRRKKKEISVEQAKELLHTARRGVLAVNGDNNYPYAIPINYFYDEKKEKIYFHGSQTGHKTDSIKKCSKVCFTVFGNETVKKEEWAPFLQSVVIFGRCHLIEEHGESMKILKQFSMKYYPNEDMVNDEINLSGKAVQIFEIDIEHLSGKEVQER